MLSGTPRERESSRARERAARRRHRQARGSLMARAHRAVTVDAITASGPGRSPHEGPRQADRPGEIAVIDHEDLDRVAAETLIEANVGAVVNAAASISGRYPNMGPLLVAAAGIPLLDNVGSEVMDGWPTGSVVTVAGDQLRLRRRDDRHRLTSEHRVARGRPLDEARRTHGRRARAVRREHARLHPARKATCSSTTRTSPRSRSTSRAVTC